MVVFSGNEVLWEESDPNKNQKTSIIDERECFCFGGKEKQIEACERLVTQLIRHSQRKMGKKILPVG